MRVVLIHGMGRTPASMWLLARRLRAAGHRTSQFGYSVTLESLASITDRFVAHVAARITDDPGPYAVVGHSLGNVITRKAFPRLPAGFVRFVMLAPPNREPVLAQRLRGNGLFRLLTRDAGQRLSDPDFYADLPVPEVPSLIIAGTRGWRARWLPFRGQTNDGIVRVEETRLHGVPSVEVGAVHTFLMNRGDVFALIESFLARGRVAEPLRSSPALW